MSVSDKIRTYAQIVFLANSSSTNHAMMLHQWDRLPARRRERYYVAAQEMIKAIGEHKPQMVSEDLECEGPLLLRLIPLSDHYGISRRDLKTIWAYVRGDRPKELAAQTLKKPWFPAMLAGNGPNL